MASSPSGGGTPIRSTTNDPQSHPGRHSGCSRDAASVRPRLGPCARGPSRCSWARRGGDAELARQARDRLVEMTQPCGNDIALGIEARSRALLSDGAAADGLYREAIDRLRRTPVRPDLARAHLLYGEWLRREGRRLEAREQLRTAYDMLDAIGMDAFAERAGRVLVATGEKVRMRGAETRYVLTSMAEQIARLARDG